MQRHLHWISWWKRWNLLTSSVCDFVSQRWILECWTFTLKLTRQLSAISPLAGRQHEETCGTVQCSSICILSPLRSDCFHLEYLVCDFLVVFQPFDVIIVGWKIIGKAGEGNLGVLIRGGQHFKSRQFNNHIWKIETYTQIYMYAEAGNHLYICRSNCEKWCVILWMWFSC